MHFYIQYYADLNVFVIQWLISFIRKSAMSFVYSNQSDLTKPCVSSSSLHFVVVPFVPADMSALDCLFHWFHTKQYIWQYTSPVKVQ